MTCYSNIDWLALRGGERDEVSEEFEERSGKKYAGDGDCFTGLKYGLLNLNSHSALVLIKE